MLNTSDLLSCNSFSQSLLILKIAKLFLNTIASRKDPLSRAIKMKLSAKARMQFLCDSNRLESSAERKHCYKTFPSFLKVQVIPRDETCSSFSGRRSVRSKLIIIIIINAVCIALHAESEVYEALRQRNSKSQTDYHKRMFQLQFSSIYFSLFLSLLLLRCSDP